METTENQQRFTEYYQLANRLIDAAEKDTLAEVARILAIHVAHYQSKHGKVTMEETLKLLHSVTLIGAYLSDDDVIRTALAIIDHRFGLKRAALNTPSAVHYGNRSMTADACP